MSIATKLKQARQKVNEIILSKGLPPDPIIIKSIPIKWEKFGNTDDIWKRISIPNDFDALACLYVGQKDSVFDFHRHESEETLIVIGKCIITTAESNRMKGIILSSGDSIKIEPNLLHNVRFLEKTLLFIVWHPTMDGDKWIAKK